MVKYDYTKCKGVYFIMVTYKFPNAKLNVVQYSEPSGRDYATTLALDEAMSDFVKRYGLHRSVFEGVNGRYLCTSVVHEPFVSNPFAVNIDSVSQVSGVLENVLEYSDGSLMGWSLIDTQRGCYSLIPAVCDRHYERVYGVVPSIEFDSVTLNIVSQEATEYYRREDLDYIASAVKSIVLSLTGFGLPIDLLEVSLIGAKYSEEAYDDDDKETCMWSEMGSFTNTTRVLNGLSVVSEKNGFEDFSDLDGKYAMVVVVWVRRVYRLRVAYN